MKLRGVAFEGTVNVGGRWASSFTEQSGFDITKEGDCVFLRGPSTTVVPWSRVTSAVPFEDAAEPKPRGGPKRPETTDA